MPFTKVTGSISAFLQGAGKHGRFRGEPLSHASFLVMVAVAQVGSDFPLLGILPGGNSHSGWRADGRVDIKLVETQPLFSEAVNMWSLGMLIPKAGKVSPPHIVNEDEDDIGPFSLNTNG